ncbi:MAG TPA: deoxynucleoside kinase [Anaerolineae bacterium]|nr:deoxynucleoside kinase [Anaerolineae bacterium]
MSPPNYSPLIIIAGNLGVGKTTLMQAICATRPDLQPFWEEPEIRPFQPGLATNPQRWSAINQVDFFIHRANQERIARTNQQISIFDGSLDQDYYVFARYLRHLGHLTTPEFDLCTRTYTLLRQLLPPPDLIIHLTAPPDTLSTRRAQRARPRDLAITPDDRLPLFATYLNEWLNLTNIPIYTLPSSDTPTFEPHLNPLIHYLNQHFPPLS